MDQNKNVHGSKGEGGRRAHELILFYMMQRAEFDVRGHT